MPDCDAAFYRFNIHQKTLSNLQQSKKSLKKRDLNSLKKNWGVQDQDTSV